MLPSRIRIRDCALRDGLQAEEPVSPEDRVAFALDLFQAGLDEIEVAAFVSPRVVPAMAGAGEVLTGVVPVGGARRWVLVPNAKGARLALEHGAGDLTMTLSVSPAYSHKNVGMSIEESLGQLEEIRALAARATLDVVVSCAFGSPFEETVAASEVARLVRRAREVGVDTVTLADTTGTAVPTRLRAVIDRTGSDVGLHLHDTRATALVNAYAALDLGVTRFDTALGGLGGSPFAPGAGGNLATEELVLLAEDLGIRTGINFDALLAAGQRLSELIGHPLPSRVATAGPLPDFEA